MSNEEINQLQDLVLLKSWLGAVEEALETGVMPKCFAVYSDESIVGAELRIGSLLAKRGIKVPLSEQE